LSLNFDFKGAKSKSNSRNQQISGRSQVKSKIKK
jgi:hypothetical protein